MSAKKPVGWEEIVNGSAGIGRIHDAIADLHIRLLRVEGKSEEAERLNALRIERPMGKVE